MSDLQCPARILVARHGDATYGGPRGVLTMNPGELTAVGARQVEQMAEGLRDERVAAVFSSPLRRATQSATIAARTLGLRPQVLTGVHEYEVGDFAGVPYADPRVEELFNAWARNDLDVGFPGGETGRQLIARFDGALQEAADRYRGETVLVMTHGGVMSVAIPHLAINVRADLGRRCFVPNAVPAVVEVDSDGVRVLSWPGTESAENQR